MKYRFLHNARVIIACCVLLALTLFFLDFTNKLPLDLAWSARIQFIPALLGGSFCVFLALFVATLLFGRIYCSIVCPLGILQDVISLLSLKLRGLFSSRSNAKAKSSNEADVANKEAANKKESKPKKKVKATKNYHYIKNPIAFRAIFLIFALACVHFGGCYFGLIEPYGVFGRIVVNIFAPVYVFFNNILSFVCPKFEVYTFYHVEQCPESWGALALGGISFVVVMIMAGRWGRLYCNSVCPVGTILGIMSKYAFFKTRIDASRCVGCGLCSKACKSSCIDVANKTVDSSRCVVCFECFNACRKNAIDFTSKKRIQLAPNETTSSNAQLDEATLRDKERVLQETKGFDRSKRNFIALTALTATAAVAKAALGDDAPKEESANAKPNADASATPVEAKPDDYGLTPFEREYTISPPGSISHKRFQKLCVGCHLCVTKCPANVLKPSGLENGLAGFMQPRVEFSRGFCNYDCTICGDVCPTGAIMPLKTEAKKLVQMGHVVFIKENCIVYAQDTSCGACSEHCPTQAVKMVPYKENLTIPEINVEICVGCGGCEYICPARPFRAIYVEGNPEHKEAKPVEKEEVKEVEDVDFGF